MSLRRSVEQPRKGAVATVYADPVADEHVRFQADGGPERAPHAARGADAITPRAALHEALAAVDPHGVTLGATAHAPSEHILSPPARRRGGLAESRRGVAACVRALGEMRHIEL
jgi:hypothetical protein